MIVLFGLPFVFLVSFALGKGVEFVNTYLDRHLE
jgi:hypothetical protein